MAAAPFAPPYHSTRERGISTKCRDCGHQVYLPSDNLQPCMGCRLRSLPRRSLVVDRPVARIPLALEAAEEFRLHWVRDRQIESHERAPYTTENFAMTVSTILWTPALESEIEINDLLWLDAGRRCRPARELPEADPEVFASRFLGVAGGRSVAGVDRQIIVSVLGVHLFYDVDDATYLAGDMLAAVVFGACGELANQSLGVTRNPSAAIGTAWEDTRAPIKFQARIESTILGSLFSGRETRGVKRLSPEPQTQPSNPPLVGARQRRKPK